jgi:hypothetical protein
VHRATSVRDPRKTIRLVQRTSAGQFIHEGISDYRITDFDGNPVSDRQWSEAVAAERLKAAN